MAASNAFSLSQASPVRRLVKAAEAGSAADFVQQFSDAHPRQHGIDHGGQCLRFGRGGRFDGSDVQTAVTQLDALEFAAPQLAGKAFQPPVEFGAAPGRTKRLCEPTIIN
jgi:hypothetical protein